VLNAGRLTSTREGVTIATSLRRRPSTNSISVEDAQSLRNEILVLKGEKLNSDAEVLDRNRNCTNPQLP